MLERVFIGLALGGGLCIIVLLVLVVTELRASRRQRAKFHELTKNPNGPLR